MKLMRYVGDLVRTVLGYPSAATRRADTIMDAVHIDRDRCTAEVCDLLRDIVEMRLPVRLK